MRVQVGNKVYKNKDVAKKEIPIIKYEMQGHKETIKDLSLKEILEHATQGKSIGCGILLNGRGNDHWTEQSIIMVDIDNDKEKTNWKPYLAIDPNMDILSVEQALEICNSFNLKPFGYYYTFSSTEAVPRYRLCFALDQTLTDSALCDKVISIITDIFDPFSDPSCKDLCRMYIGTNKEYVFLSECYNSVEDILKCEEFIKAPAETQTPAQKNEIKKIFKSSHSSDNEFYELIKTYDLKSLMLQENEKPKDCGRYIAFSGRCSICGHNDDLRYYKSTNTWTCFSNPKKSGNAYTYLRESENHRLEPIEAIKEIYAFHGKEFTPKKKNPPAQDKIIFTDEFLADYLSSTHRSIRYNEITRENTVVGFAGENQELLSANVATILYNELIQIDNLKHCTKQLVVDNLALLSSRNNYNPVLECLNSVEWDKTDRISELYEILNIAKDDLLSKNLILKWLLQCVSMLYNKASEPFGADGVLVLSGKQGIGKTSFFRKLALKPEFFKEGITLNFSDKDTLIQATSCWIGELGEIESTFKSDVEKLRSFITKAVDEFRPPYGHASIKALRRTSFCGTCNSDEFLVDELGNRRYYTVPVNDINLDKLRQLNVIQLWKQIQIIVADDLNAFRLSKEEQQYLLERNTEHLKPCKGEDAVRTIIEPALADRERSEANNGVGANYIWQEVTITQFIDHYGITLKGLDPSTVGKVLNKLGIEQRQVRGKGKVRFLPLRTSDKNI